MPILSEVVLRTPAPARLGRFLCELLDLEIRDVDSRLLLTGAGPTLSLEESLPGEGLATQANLEFQAESEEELKALWQRYVFVMYRLQGERIGPHAPLARRQIPGTSEEQVILILKDPDHRVWTFKAVHSLQ